MSIFVEFYKLGSVEYSMAHRAMLKLVSQRRNKPYTRDEIWLLEHPSVFTQGLTSDLHNTPLPCDIPIVQSDRGGKMTYHGPGQLIAYLILDIGRLNLNVRELVTRIESSIIGLLASYGISSASKDSAPGVYIKDKKIASLGLRIRNNLSFHGLALNVDMDLSPFKRINPCGYRKLIMTQLSDHITPVNFSKVREKLCHYLMKHLGHTEYQILEGKSYYHDFS